MIRVRHIACFALTAMAAITVLLAPTAVQADQTWSLALKTDAEILAAVDSLDADAPGADSEQAVILLREIGWDVLPGNRDLYRNTVLRVNDTAQLASLVSSFYLDARGETASVEAFRIRNGKVERFDIGIERGDGKVQRTRLNIAMDQIQPGDIVGLSSITRFDNILYFSKLPICGRFPVANFRLRVAVAKNHLYKIQADNFDGLKVGVVATNEDGRPVEWLATAHGIAAVEDLRSAGPYAPGTPLAFVVESAEFVPAVNNWVTTLAWSRVALFLGGLRDQGMASMMAAANRTPEVIAHASTDLEKEAAIFAFVQGEFESLSGEAYDPLGFRSAEEVFKSGQATPLEEVMIMSSMLAAAGLPGEIAVVRTADWGPLDQELPSFVQFNDLAVACGASGERLYVSYVDGAPAGSLPPAWGECWVLSPAPGLTARLSEAAAQVMSTPNVDAHAAFLQLREEAKEKGWYRLVQVGGGKQ